MNFEGMEEKLVIQSLLICATFIETVLMETMKIITFAVSWIIFIKDTIEVQYLTWIR